MKNEKPGKIVFLTIIAGRKQKDEILSALTETGARLLNTIYGKGAVKSSYLQSLLGLVPEENKVIITCIMTSEKAEDVMLMLINKFEFDKPNTGIAFTVPVGKFSV